MQKDFPKQLIKGKIAEMIFDQMFRKVKTYTVIPFGYEAIIPELIQYTNQADHKEMLDNIRSAPDFALVTHDPKEVLLVEVKYRSQPDLADIKNIATQICDKWKLVWLFLATPKGFYFNSCEKLASGADLMPLSHQMIPKDIQDEFLHLLVEFIK